MGSWSAASWGGDDIPSDLPGGVLVGPDGPGELRGGHRPVGSSAASHDRDAAHALRARAADRSGMHPDVAE